MRKYVMGSFAEPRASQLTLGRVLLEGALLLGMLAASSWVVWR
jgi:hypothetical protein